MQICYYMYVFLESSSTSRVDGIVISFTLVFDVFVIISHWGRGEMAAVQMKFRVFWLKFH